MKYVSVFKRPGRLNWYVNYLDATTGKRKCNVRTAFPVADPQGYRKALDYANELSLAAKALKAGKPGEAWNDWVPGFIALHYRASKASATRAGTSWKQLRTFLHLRGLTSPRAITYAHAQDYLVWRTAQEKRSGKHVSHNTALQDLRLLSMLVRHAVRQGLAPANPLERLGIERDEVKEKCEITDPEIATIREHLPEAPEWMTMAFEIAIRQGCRLAETRVHRSQVDFARGVITFRAKGGKVFGTKLHPDLAPLLKARFAKHEWSHDCTNPIPASLQWRAFFDRIELPHLSFHCTRVTVITRMARAGVPIQQAMAYVGHASSTIHRIYQKLKPADLSAAAAAIRV